MCITIGQCNLTFTQVMPSALKRAIRLQHQGQAGVIFYISGAVGSVPLLDQSKTSNQYSIPTWRSILVEPLDVLV